MAIEAAMNLDHLSQRTLLSRRQLLRAGVGGAALALMGEPAMGQSILRKPIPRSGELLPVVGLGTWQTFDVGTGPSERAPLKEVLREFVQRSGAVIDSSPMYGRSETVVGEIAADIGVHKQLFVATKVWTSGRDAGMRQMEESIRRLRVQKLDLMQVHNLVDYRTHLTTLRKWRDEGKIRYLGVTHYHAGAYAELARVLATEELDFVQLNYSMAERDAEERLLPLAADKRIAVLVNRPFAQGALFKRTSGKTLPPWTKEIGCASWSQFFLKFVVAHPAVTCAIPATSKVSHLIDNMQAGAGPLPDARMRARMARDLVEA
jgi:aryl-alcohol dehydrogenase-like predicted oxidoreductase